MAKLKTCKVCKGREGAHFGWCSEVGGPGVKPGSAPVPAKPAKSAAKPAAKPVAFLLDGDRVVGEVHREGDQLIGRVGPTVPLGTTTPPEIPLTLRPSPADIPAVDPLEKPTTHTCSVCGKERTHLVHAWRRVVPTGGAEQWICRPCHGKGQVVGDSELAQTTLALAEAGVFAPMGLIGEAIASAKLDGETHVVGGAYIEPDVEVVDEAADSQDDPQQHMPAPAPTEPSVLAWTGPSTEAEDRPVLADPASFWAARTTLTDRHAAPEPAPALAAEPAGESDPEEDADPGEETEEPGEPLSRGELARQQTATLRETLERVRLAGKKQAPTRPPLDLRGLTPVSPITPGVRIVPAQHEDTRPALSWTEATGTVDWDRYDVEASAFSLWVACAEGLPEAISFSYRDDVLALEGLNITTMETAVRFPDRVEIRPESRDKGYPILGFHRGDVMVVLGMRIPRSPAVIAAYWTALLGHDTHRVEHVGGGGAKRQTGQGLPKTIKQSIKQLTLHGAMICEDWETQPEKAVPVSYAGQDLGKITVVGVNRQQVETDYQRTLRKINAIKQREAVS